MSTRIIMYTHTCSAYERKRGICLLCLAYFTWCNYLQFHPLCLQMAQLLSSLPLNKIPLCRYTTFISADGHLEWFYILVTVNTAAINMDVQAFPGVLSSIQWNSWIIDTFPFLFVRLGQGLLCSSCWLWTSNVPQDGLELVVILPQQPFEYWKLWLLHFVSSYYSSTTVLFPGAYYNQM